MLKQLLNKQVQSPLSDDDSTMPLYKAIAFLSIPCALIVLVMLAIFFQSKPKN